MPKVDQLKSSIENSGPSAFVNVRWNSAMEERYMDWAKSMTPELYHDALKLAVDQDLRISLGKSNDGYVATLRDREREAAGKPCALSGWGGDPWEALTVALFKHTEVCVGYNWDTFESEARGVRH